jgi:hypothetical protein
MAKTWTKRGSSVVVGGSFAGLFPFELWNGFEVVTGSPGDSESCVDKMSAQ